MNYLAGVDVSVPLQQKVTNINPPQCGWHPTNHPELGGDAMMNSQFRVPGPTTLFLQGWTSNIMVSRLPFYKPYYRVGADPEVPTVRPRSVGADNKSTTTAP